MPLAVNDASYLEIPASATIPPNSLTVTFAIIAGLPGVAILTAGPLNGSRQFASIRILSRLPSIVDRTGKTSQLRALVDSLQLEFLKEALPSI